MTFKCQYHDHLAARLFIQNRVKIRLCVLDVLPQEVDTDYFPVSELLCGLACPICRKEGHRKQKSSMATAFDSGIRGRGTSNAQCGKKGNCNRNTPGEKRMLSRFHFVTGQIKKCVKFNSVPCEHVFCCMLSLDTCGSGRGALFVILNSMCNKLGTLKRICLVLTYPPPSSWTRFLPGVAQSPLGGGV